MDLLFGLLGFFGVLVPPKDERGKRWHRIGCFVTLGFGFIAAIIGGFIFLRGSF